MDFADALRWLFSAFRTAGRPALAYLVDSYPHLPRPLRDGVWTALEAELSPTDPRERILRDAVKAIGSVGGDQFHRVERARDAWYALAT